MLDDAVHAVLTAYPTIHVSCRRRYHSRRRRRRGTVSNHLASVLDQLDPVEPTTVGELAGRMRVTPATISLQLARLNRLRLVTRAQSTQDARRVELRLSDSGRRLREQRSLLDPDRVRTALGRLTEAERDTVVAGVRLLARAAADLQPLPPAPSS